MGDRLRFLARLKSLIITPIVTRFERTQRLGRPRPSDTRSLVENHNRSWVYICASRNAETIAGVPLKLYVRAGKRTYYGRRALSLTEKKYLGTIGKGVDADNVDEITENHPLLDLLDFMNPEHARSEVMEATVTYQELSGDSYWYLEPGPLGLPIAIWPLMSQYVRAVRNDAADLVGYLYGKNEQDRIALAAADVIHFSYPNPKDPDYGLSPLAATFGAATLLEAQEEYQRTLYDSGGIPEVGLMIKERITQPERDALYAQWADKYASKRRGEKMMILEGDMDIKTFGYPPSDVLTEFTQKFAREEIAAAFGLPMTMIQLSEASRAGAEAGHYSYLKFTIEPKLRKIAEKLTERLAARYDPRLFFAFQNPVPEDREFERLQTQTRLTSGMTTINEERALAGMDPVAWGNVPLLPSNLYPLGGTGAPKPVAIAPPLAEPDKDKDKAARKGWENDPTRQEISFRGALVDHLVGMITETDGKIESEGY